MCSVYFNSCLGKLVQEEEKELGSVKCTNYAQLVAFGGKTTFFVFFFFLAFVHVNLSLFLILLQAIRTYNEFWLGAWGGDKYDQDTPFYMKYFAIIAAVYFVALFFRGII